MLVPAAVSIYQIDPDNLPPPLRLPCVRETVGFLQIVYFLIQREKKIN